MKHDFVGYKFMKASPNAHTYKASPKLNSGNLPNKVDLRPHHTKVEDQGQVGSCTANAVVGACEYLLKKKTDKTIDLSRLFLYYNARLRGGSQDKDSGSVIQYAVESLQKLGICSEKTWLYDTKKVLQKPDEKSYQEAAKFKISDFQKVEVNLETWKKCLAEGYPIIFGCALFKTFDECTKKGGIVAMPSPEDTTRGSHGLHAMLCVGYSEDDQMFIVRNSWGDDFGDKGYCYMPYNYLMNTKFNLNDCWIIKSTDSIPNYEETWSNKKGTVINDGKGVVGFDPAEYNYYTDDDYADFDIYVFLIDSGYMDGDGEYYEDEPEEYVETLSFFEDFEPEDDEFEFDDEFEEDEEEFDSAEFGEEDESEEEEDFEDEEESEEDEEFEEDEEEEEEPEEDEEEELEDEEESEEDEEFEEDEEEEEEPEEEEEFEDEEEEEEPEEEEEEEFEEEEPEEEEVEEEEIEEEEPEEEPEEDFSDEGGEDSSEEE